jgi:hypothetical protein
MTKIDLEALARGETPPDDERKRPHLDPKPPTVPHPTAEEIEQLARTPDVGLDLDELTFAQQQDTRQKVQRLREKWAKNRSRAHTIDIDNPDEPDAPYLIKGLIPSGVTVWIWGRKMAGKSFNAIDLGCHFAMGDPWMGHEVERSKVLYVQIEDSKQIMSTRVHAWENVNGPVDRSDFQIQVDPDWRFTGTYMDHQDTGNGEEMAVERRVPQTRDVADLITRCREDGIGVVIIDVLSAAMAGDSNMSSSAVGAMLEAANQIVNEGKVTLFVVAHSNEKDSSIAGLATQQDRFNSEFHVRQFKDRRTIELVRTKTVNLDKLKPMVFDVVDSGIEDDGRPVGVVKFRGSDDNAHKLIMQAVYTRSDDLPMWKKDIESQIRSAGYKIDHKRCGEAIDELVEDGKLVRIGSQYGLPDD